MGQLFKAISNWFRQKKDDAAEGLADPVRDGKFAIEDSQKFVRGFEEKLAHLLGFNKNQERKLRDLVAEAIKWENIAKKAAQAKNTDDVRTAVTSKQNAEAQRKTLSDEVEKTKKEITSVKVTLEKARTKIARAQSDHVRLDARLEASKVRTELARARSDFGNTSSPLAALDNLEKAVHAAESEAEAREELASEAPQAQAEALEDKYDASGASVDDEVARLMAEAGATSPEPQPQA